MNSVYAKLVAIVTLSVGCFIFGFIPALIGFSSNCGKSVLLSITSCFGGGVLLATSLVHLLPDIRSDVHQWAEILICLGFFVIYLVDVFSSSFTSMKSATNDGEALLSNGTRTYGSIEQRDEVFISNEQEISVEKGEFQQWSNLNCGILVAFTTHALLEGLVVGIQDSTDDVFILLGAICSHKLLVAFSLGAELLSGGQPWKVLIFPLSVFVLGSDLGIVLGMFFNIGGLPMMQIAIPYIEGIAGGTLLYISLCEIIPREKKKKMSRLSHFFQIIGMFMGFSLMSALSIYL